MWAREQSYSYLKQYIRAKNETPWIVQISPEATERAKCNLQHVGGIAGDWYPYRSDCTCYRPQKVKE
jgi:hypothetical protein